MPERPGWYHAGASAKVCSEATGAPHSASAASASALASKASTGAARRRPVARAGGARADTARDQRLAGRGGVGIGRADLEQGARPAKPRAALRPAAAISAGRIEGRMSVELGDEIGLSSLSSAAPPPNSRGRAVADEREGDRLQQCRARRAPRLAQRAAALARGLGGLGERARAASVTDGIAS